MSAGQKGIPPHLNNKPELNTSKSGLRMDGGADGGGYRGAIEKEREEAFFPIQPQAKWILDPLSFH